MTDRPCWCQRQPAKHELSDRCLTFTDQIARVRRILGDTYTPEGVTVWLATRNLNLDKRAPVDLLAEGDDYRVVTEAFSVAGGWS